MNWEELRQRVIDEIESALVCLDVIIYKGYFFWSNGKVETSTKTFSSRTPSEMYKKLLKLKDTKSTN